jgi:hypothetical protein
VAPEDTDIPPDVLSMHPLLTWLAAQLQPAEGDGEKLTVDEPVIEELSSALLSLAGKEDLRKAALDLFAFSFVLEREHTSPTLARALIAVLNQESVIQAMEALPPPPPSTEERVVSAASRFAQFSDRDAKKAPQVEERAPDGSVKLDTLNPSRRV